jgi:restriction endonuclease S subunit
VWHGEIDECIHQNHIFRARPNRAVVEPKFVSWHGNLFGQAWFSRTGTQTTNLASINKGILRRFPVPIAPLNEQRCIVATIEELLSDLDAGVSALVRARANLKRYRAAVLRAAVNGELTAEWRATHPNVEPAPKLLDRVLAERRRKWEADQQAKFNATGKIPTKHWQDKYREPQPPETSNLPQLPAGWSWASLEQVCNRITDGTHLPPPFVPIGIPFIFVQHIVGGSIRFEGTKFISPETYAALNSRCPVEQGDILYSAVGSYGVAVVVETDQPFSFQRHIAHVKPANEMTSKYLAFCLNSSFCLAQAHRRARGVAQKTVTLGDLSAFVIPVAPAAEQTAIVSEIEQRLSIIAATENYIAASLKRAGRLRQSILKEAFSGRLVPQDPADEPASALLDRIRHAHAASNGSTGVARERSRRKTSDQPELFESKRIVDKAWNFATVLWHDGVPFLAYTEEITFLLFLKMADELTRPPYSRPPIVPPELGWPSLLSREGEALKRHYDHILQELARKPGMLGDIFKRAKSAIEKPEMLRRLIVDLIDPEKWVSMDADVKGDVYEGLLARSMSDGGQGAGQYFTPRELIKALVDCVRPTADDNVCDPACGTGGFLLGAYDYVVRHQGKELDKDQKKHLRSRFVRGWELVPNTARLCIMNLYLHGIDDPAAVRSGVDSLAADPGERFSLVLTNPPFGKKAPSPSSTRRASWSARTPATSGRTSGRPPRTSS